MKDALNRSGSAGKKQTEKTYNLDFPENHPSDEASMARARRARLWPPREVEAAKRWVEEPLAAALEKAAAGDRRTLIVLHGPRGAGFPEVFAQVLPGFSSANLDDEHARLDAEDAPVGFLERREDVSVLLLRNVHRAPRFLSYLLETAGSPHSSAPRRGPKTIVVSATADVPLLSEQPDNPYVVRLRLRTLAQGELTGINADFPERLTVLDFPAQLSYDESNRDLALEIAMHGGYPVGRLGTADQRHDFFHDLIRKVCAADLKTVSSVKNQMTLRKVYRMVGAASGEVLNYTKIAETLDIGRPLVRRCVEALEALYLIEPIAVWPQAEAFERSVRSERYVVTDSGWLCGLLGFCDVDPCTLPEGSFGIVRRLIAGWTWAQFAAMTDNRDDWKLWQFALRTGVSVELLLENQRTGTLLAIETSPRERDCAEDFANLNKFRSLVPDRDVRCLRLYCGQSVQRFDGIGTAVPLAFLWR